MRKQTNTMAGPKYLDIQFDTLTKMENELVCAGFKLEDTKKVNSYIYNTFSLNNFYVLTTYIGLHKNSTIQILYEKNKKYYYGYFYMGYVKPSSIDNLCEYVLNIAKNIWEWATEIRQIISDLPKYKKMIDVGTTTLENIMKGVASEHEAKFSAWKDNGEIVAQIGKGRKILGIAADANIKASGMQEMIKTIDTLLTVMEDIDDLYIAIEPAANGTKWEKND